MLLKKGNISRNVAENEAAPFISQGYEVVTEADGRTDTGKTKKEPKPKAKG